MVTDIEPTRDCQFMRYLNPRECVVRLMTTGAIISIRLATPLNAAQACLVTAINPVQGRVGLGPLNHNRFDGCLLDVTWPPNMRVMPPPVRFQRRKTQGGPVHKTKRQKTETGRI